MSWSVDVLEVGYVTFLYGGYLVLWRAKRAAQLRGTGTDPVVLGRSTRPLQRYFAGATRVLTAAALLLVVIHAGGYSGPGFQGHPALAARWADHLGLATGVTGLVLCFVAQRTMGAAWRVGIDEGSLTPLVQSGVFGHIRNPTYLGLFLVNLGFWLIWPTASVGVFGLAFFILIEVQVRCEEEHLEALHGKAFRAYCSRTARYVPHVY
jgi:protein-S-isoprenylcysteine O-methyltransferase Ste14